MSMTVKIYPATNGRVAFETVDNFPVTPIKHIMGLAPDKEYAKRRSIKYAGTDTEFIYEGV